jgi:hypothetical protein
MTRFRRDRDAPERRAEVIGLVRTATAVELEPVAEEQPSKTEPAVEELSPSRIGEQVATVLQTAQEAAQRIRDDAQAEADELLERVTREAFEHRDRSAREANDRRSEAERIFREAEERSKQAVEEGERLFQQRQQEAEEQAGATVAKAKAEAANISEEANARHEELLTNVSVAENRLRALSAGLRSVAGELEELVEGGDGGQLDESLRARIGPTEEHTDSG